MKIFIKLYFLAFICFLLIFAFVRRYFQSWIEHLDNFEGKV